LGEPGFRGLGKRFVDDFFERPGGEGDNAQFSDDSNASDLDNLTSDSENEFIQK